MTACTIALLHTVLVVYALGVWLASQMPQSLYYLLGLVSVGYNIGQVSEQSHEGALPDITKFSSNRLP